MAFQKKIRKNYDRKIPTHDYLKYWRVIRHWAKVTYGLGVPDLDMMFFLYSEQIFSKDKFKEFQTIMVWDVNRFDRLLRDGWIGVWKKREKKKKTLYELSYKGKRAIEQIYRKLNGEEISERNPMFLASGSYTDKVYRNMIIKMNESIRQQQRQTPKE